MRHPNQLVRVVPAPEESLVRDLYLGANLLDAYATRLNQQDSHDVRRLATQLLTRTPGWMRMLLAVRDVLVKAFGIKTSGALLRAAPDGDPEHISFMRVYQSSANEMILGEDDRHLDFRLSVLIRRVGSGSAEFDEVVTTTVVHCHNRLGRVYLWLIGPFHRAIAKSLLRRLHTLPGQTIW